MVSTVLFVDVDDTLIRSAGSKRIPIPGSVALVQELHRLGTTLYLWSTGGSEYARATAIELGIQDCFVGFLPKPRALIDDVRIEAGRCSSSIPTRLSRSARKSC